MTKGSLTFSCPSWSSSAATLPWHASRWSPAPSPRPTSSYSSSSSSSTAHSSWPFAGSLAATPSPSWWCRTRKSPVSSFHRDEEKKIRIHHVCKCRRKLRHPKRFFGKNLSYDSFYKGLRYRLSLYSERRVATAVKKWTTLGRLSTKLAQRSRFS